MAVRQPYRHAGDDGRSPRPPRRGAVDQRRPTAAGAGASRPEVAGDGGTGGRGRGARRAGQPSYVRWALDGRGGRRASTWRRSPPVRGRRPVDGVPAHGSKLAGLLDDPSAALRALPFFEDLVDRYGSRGVDGLVGIHARVVGRSGRSARGMMRGRTSIALRRRARRASGCSRLSTGLPPGPSWTTSWPWHSAELAGPLTPAPGWCGRRPQGRTATRPPPRCRRPRRRRRRSGGRRP